MVPRPIQPQNSKRKNAFHGGIVAGCSGEQRPSTSAFVHHAANVQAGNECSRSGTAVSESTTASGKRSWRMHSKWARNCSRVILPAARGESARRNSRRPGLVRPNLCTSSTMRSSAHSFTRRTRRVRLRSSDHKMDQRLLLCAIYFALQRVQFGEPLAVFAGFHAPQRRKIASRRDRVPPNSPQARSMAYRRSLECRFRAFQLFQNQAGYIYRWILMIPLRGNMFERNLKIAALACRQRICIWCDE
jgi:hypothetical protein